ncbi:DUF7853 family protein [Halogeometricum limi]|uniref:Uncharacterized protein n=1 Tax=Halogeometricum limi TaxID=555875 RepID=A0A1I6FUT9_9EURY|nr:hypothetical protein [Halogeometricum limi]SFR33700.1 hypothetical protein SAMN04488124_0343 [Halogeometricum limi]
MTASAHNSSTALDLDVEEAWALHAALLSAIEDAVQDGDDPETAVSLLERLEDGDDFDSEELECLVETLRDYVEHRAPSRDRGPARNVISDIQTALA